MSLHAGLSHQEAWCLSYPNDIATVNMSEETRHLNHGLRRSFCKKKQAQQFRSEPS